MGDLHRLIAFDLDGTLVDSRRDLAESANQLVAELGGRVLAEDAVGRMVGQGAAQLVQRALSAAGVADVTERLPAALARFLAIYDVRLLDHTRPYDGVVDALVTARRHARVAVLTNKPVTASERILAGLGLRGLVDEVVGGDGPLPRKPDPAALIDLMTRAGAEAGRTLLVGDSVFDRRTAGAASAWCCLAAYGYGYATFPADELTGDEWIATDARDLSGIIRRFIARTA